VAATNLLLDVQGLKVNYRTSRGTVKAVDGVNLRAKRKEVVGIVGESGCGKSTTGLSIMRLIRSPGEIVGGKILFKNKDLLELSEDEMTNMRGKEISMTFQHPLSFLNPVFTVEYQIAEAISLHQGASLEEGRKAATEMLGKVGIPTPMRIGKYYPHQLSGGMRQRVLIAIALACNPSLIIADEPTSALDVSVQAQILDLIKELNMTLGTSLLLITHNLGIVASMCDRVYVMYAGRVVEEGDVFSIFENPMHPYTVGLIGSIPSPHERKKRFETIPGMVPDLTNPPSGCRFNPRCLRATSKCEEDEPPYVEVEPGHFVSCWRD